MVYSGPEESAHQVVLAYFGLFDNCNARCNMCNCWELPRATLPLAHYEKVLDRLIATGIRAVRFTGGEALLFRDLDRLIDRAHRHGVRTSVISNGRILPGMVDRLASAGCDEIVLSIDAVGDVHDDIRGTPGLFARCGDAIERIAGSTMTYGVNTVVQRTNIDGLHALADFLHGVPAAPTWWHLIPVRGHQPLHPLPAQVTAFPGVLRQLRQRCAAAGIDLVATPDMFDGTGDGERSATTPRCGVPSAVTYVRADSGEVFGCNMLAYADPPLGNLGLQPPDEVYGSRARLSLIDACAAGSHPACARCDRSSREMNHYLTRVVEGSGR
jgi:MoaA/NifB/PqqE/SkfB family radical SAM enzyme